MLILQRNHKRLNILLGTKSTRKFLKSRFTLDDAVGFVLEIAHRETLCVLDVYCRSAEVTSAKVGKFTAEMGLGGPATAIGLDLGDGVFCYGRAEVI
jgi:hypothetical protein